MPEVILGLLSKVMQESAEALGDQEWVCQKREFVRCCPWTVAVLQLQREQHIELPCRTGCISGFFDCSALELGTCCCRDKKSRDASQAGTGRRSVGRPSMLGRRTTSSSKPQDSAEPAAKRRKRVRVADCAAAG